MAEILIIDPGKNQKNYQAWLERAHFLPAWLKPGEEIPDPLPFLGLLLPGGGDIDPSFYGEENRHSQNIHPSRDRLEIEVFHRFLKARKPILGICRGIQVMNVALGGTLIQDLISEAGIFGHSLPASPDRDTYHLIEIAETSFLFIWLNESSLVVNSHHHQAIGKLAPDLQVSARSLNGVIEAVESHIYPNLLGVQWHPERLPFSHPASDKILRFFTSSTE